MAYLDTHPPERSQFRPRREALSGVIVVHTAENTPDHVAFDGGAEAVARFIQGRSDAGSYHDIVDSDSAIDLVDYDVEAFHDGTGSNPHSLGLSVATRADVWPWAPQAWRDGAVEQAAQRAARMARHVKARTGIVIPPRRITRAESERRVPGFISHAERDPTRRTDPGRDFPWGIFLSRYAALTGDLTNASEDFMALTDKEQRELLDRVRAMQSGRWVLPNGEGDLSWLDEKLAPIQEQIAGFETKFLAFRDDSYVNYLLIREGDGDGDLSDEQVRRIIAALPAAVKQALREGVG